MSTASPAARALAERLVALESDREADRAATPAACACEKLRPPLSRLAGAEGFRSLLARALAMAKAEYPSLGAATVLADGSLEGPDEEGGVAVVAHLLGLLMTFIGEPLTLQLVRDVWPDPPAGGADRDAGGQP